MFERIIYTTHRHHTVFFYLLYLCYIYLMNKLYSIFFCITVLCSSCGSSIYEEIRLDENGKGTYHLHSDILPAMKNMAYTFAKMGNSDSTKTIDSAKAVQKIFKDFPAEFDSTLDLTKKLDAETKNNPAKMKLIKNSRMYMKGGSKAGVIELGLISSFDNIAEMNNLGSTIDKQNKKSKDQGLLLKNSETVYSYKNNVFRKSPIPSTSKKTSADADTKKEESFNKMFFSNKDAVFQTTIHFKRKIKKINAEHIKIQNDTMVVISYPMQDYMYGKANETIEIEFE